MAQSFTPREPRAMADQRGIADASFRDISGDLYAKLVLYEALAGYQGDQRRRKDSEDDLVEARRDFLDSFAYLCDVQKGGSTVTAAAIQELDHGNCLWLSANEGVQRRVLDHANMILNNLNKWPAVTEEVVQIQIFQLVIRACGPRVEFYKSKVQLHARNCRMQLRKPVYNESEKALRSVLQKLSEPPVSSTVADIINRCYTMRGKEVEDIRRITFDPEEDFSKLSHYIGRLGASRASVNTVVRSFQKVASLQRISHIRSVDAPPKIEVRLTSTQLSPYEVVRGICTRLKFRNPIEERQALHKIVDLDISPTRNLRDGLTRSIITRAHAELQMADQFGRMNLRFAAGDKYIGCSKPACYFCYNWLCNKLNYVPPATHNKIVLGCRGPDNDINASGEAILKNMYAKMNGDLDRDIMAFLLRDDGKLERHRHQFLSTNGTSRATSHY